MLHRELLEFFSWKTRTYLLGLLFTVTIPYLKASSKGLFHSDVPVFPSHMLGHWTIRKKETKGKKEQSQSSIVVCVFSLSILSYIWNICFISNQYQIWDWQVQHGGGNSILSWRPSPWQPHRRQHIHRQNNAYLWQYSPGSSSDHL